MVWKALFLYLTSHMKALCCFFLVCEMFLPTANVYRRCTRAKRHEYIPFTVYTRYTPFNARDIILLSEFPQIFNNHVIKPTRESNWFIKKNDSLCQVLHEQYSTYKIFPRKHKYCIFILGYVMFKLNIFPRLRESWKHRWHSSEGPSQECTDIFFYRTSIFRNEGPIIPVRYLTHIYETKPWRVFCCAI